VTHLVRGIIAFEQTAGRQSSGSSELCPFAARIDFCPQDPIELLADALVHESAHIKLRLTQLVGQMCPPDGAASYHHPWRREARPLSAVVVAPAPSRTNRIAARG